jgi:hypothetical protein
MAFKDEAIALKKVIPNNHVKAANSEDMLNSNSILRLPWRFTDPLTEATYKAKRSKRSNPAIF